MSPKDDGPPMEFDGRIFWYVEYFEQDGDLCCAPDCRQPIDEDEVPLILFKGTGKDCRQARLHVACAERLGLFRSIRSSR
jgi:hypothetical protein